MTRDGRVGPDEEEVEFFGNFFWRSDCSYSERTGDRESVTLRSDFDTLPQWRSSELFDWMPPIAAFDRSMCVALPSAPQHSRRVRFLRRDGCEFSETERALATLLRPYLAQHLHDLDREAAGVLPLTVRQQQLMAMLVDGYSNAQIARALGITAATVRTHLQQMYARLGVNSRGEAVALTLTARPQTIRRTRVDLRGLAVVASTGSG